MLPRITCFHFLGMLLDIFSDVRGSGVFLLAIAILNIYEEPVTFPFRED